MGKRRNYDWYKLWPQALEILESQDVANGNELALLLGVNPGSFHRNVSLQLEVSTRDMTRVKEAIKLWIEANPEPDKPRVRISPPPEEEPPEEPPPESLQFQYSDNGTVSGVTSERIIQIQSENDKTPERMLELHGFDPQEWRVKDIQNTVWTGQRGQKIGGGHEYLYASKLKAVPVLVGETPIGDVFRLIEEKFGKIIAPAKPIKPKKYDPNEQVLYSADADMHNGLEPYEGEYKMAEVMQAVTMDIVDRAKRLKLSQIRLPYLGDNVHVDTKKRTTAAGTQMTTSMPPEDAIAQALELAVWQVEQLAKIAPVEFIHIPGNHDPLISYVVALAVEQRFRDSPSITVDAGKAARKARLEGINLVGLMHGELPKLRKNRWLADEFPELWGKAEYRMIIAGHLHSEQVESAGGVTVHHVTSPAPPDEWHYEKAYSTRNKGITSFLLDPNRPGVRAKWFSGV